MTELFNFVLQRPTLDLPVSETVPVNREQMLDIRDMVNSTPAILMALRNFDDSTLIQPFEVRYGVAADGQGDEGGGGAGYFALKPELQTMLINKHWMPWLRTMNEWTTRYGFCPFYFEEGTHVVDDDPTGRSGPRKILLRWPRTPELELGSVETFVYEREQFLVWKWAREKTSGRDGGYDLKMFFVIEDMPTLGGLCTSRMASLLPDWRALCHMKIQDAHIVQSMAQRRAVVEFNPHIGGGGGGNSSDQTYLQGQHPSSHIPSVMVGTAAASPQTPGDRARSYLDGVNQAYTQMLGPPGQALNRSAINAGLDPIGALTGGAPQSIGDVRRQAFQDEMLLLFAKNPEQARDVNLIMNPLPNAHYLAAYQRYVPMPVASSSLTALVAQLTLDFERKASVVLDSPLDLSLGAQSDTPAAMASMATQSEFMHRRVKYRIRFFCTALKHVFKLAYLSAIERVRSDLQRVRKLHSDLGRDLAGVIALEKALDFHIVFRPSVGDLSDERIFTYYSTGAIDDDEAFQLIYQKLAFSDPPLKAPPEFRKRMRELYRQPPPEPTGESPAKKPKTGDAAEKKK